MPSILIVCTGNICRSPIAEAYLRQRLAQERIPGEWEIISAGTWAQDGLPASETGVAVMRERGLDTSRHRSRNADAALLARVDLVLTMTASHAEVLRAEFPSAATKIFRLTEMAGPPFDIRDPYGGSLNDYRRTADELERQIEQGLPRIMAAARQNSA